MRSIREAVVAPGKHADAALAHAAHDVDGHRELMLESPGALAGDAPLAGGLAQVVRDAEGGADEDPIARGFEGIERALVGIVRVIDDLHAVAKRHHDGFRAPAVRGDAQAARPRHLHGRFHLRVRHRRLLGWPGRGSDVAGEVELQQINPFPGEQAAHAANSVGPVGHPGEGRRLVVGQVEQVAVAEPARDGDLGAVGEEAGPRDAPGIDLALQDHVQARLGRRRRERAGVAAIEHGARVAHRDEHVLFDGQARQIQRAEVGQADVGVRLDEAGHQRGAGAVDHCGPVGRGRGCSRRHLRDPVALHPHRAEKGLPAGAIEDPRIGDQMAHPEILPCPGNVARL